MNNKILVAQFYTSNVSYGPYSEAINKKYCKENNIPYSHHDSLWNAYKSFLKSINYFKKII